MALSNVHRVIITEWQVHILSFMMRLLQIYCTFIGPLREKKNIQCFASLHAYSMENYDHDSDLLATVFLVPTASTELQVPLIDLLLASTVATPYRYLNIAK